MGYELALLVSEVDDEFLCSICTMVLENPMQSPCEHIFCNNCIKQWLNVKASCPVDSYLLALADMKPTPRFFRNMLDKVEVKCNFEPKGCQTIVPLGQQHHHLTECAFNPNAEVICDKGCNIKITRGEYETANCFTHLANRQRDEITKLSDELNDVRCEVTRSANVITKLTDEGSMQRDEITNLSDNVGQQRDEISKLSDELNDVLCAVRSSANVIERQREEITKLADVVSRQQDEITKLNDCVGRQREDFTKLTNNGSMQLEEITNLSDEIDQQRDEIASLSDEVDQQKDDITNVNGLSRVSCIVTRSANVIELQNGEITKLTDKCNMQRDEITKLSDEVDLHRDEITKLRALQEDLIKLTDEGNAQRDQIKKLSDEVRRFTNLIQRQQEEITELKDSDDVGRQRKNDMVIDEARICGKATAKWQIFQNMKTSIDQPQVLEHDEDGFSLAQTLCSLEPSSSSFKIKVLNTSGIIVIGLTPVILSSWQRDTYPGIYEKSIGYYNRGILFYNGDSEYVKAAQTYGKGDVIECGIIFPDNFENDGKTNVEVYFSLNEQIIVKKVMVIPLDGFFPTVSMWQELSEPRARVEFLNLI